MLPAVTSGGGTIRIGDPPMDCCRIELVTAFDGVEDGGRLPEVQVRRPVGREAAFLGMTELLMLLVMCQNRLSIHSIAVTCIYPPFTRG